MKLKRNLFFTTLVFTLISISAIGQNETKRKFIQCVFSNMEKPQQAKEIQEFIKTQEGVYMIRANFNSRKFFLIYEASSSISIADLDNWMEKFSLEYKCLREGTHGIDKVIDQNIDCE